MQSTDTFFYLGGFFLFAQVIAFSVAMIPSPSCDNVHFIIQAVWVILIGRARLLPLMFSDYSCAILMGTYKNLFEDSYIYGDVFITHQIILRLSER